MKELKKTKSIGEYVKEYFLLMLQIRNMAEEDLLFNFLDGLQSWAANELKRRRVQNISDALTMAETLMDYRKGDSGKSKNFKPNHSKGGGAKEFQPPESKEEKGKPPKWKEQKRNGHRGNGPKSNCFLCDGDHWVKDCPKKKAFNAMYEAQYGGEQSRIGCMQLFNSLKAKRRADAPTGTALMYIEAYVNCIKTQVLVDMGLRTTSLSGRKWNAWAFM